jgi:hypothetical protein
MRREIDEPAISIVTSLIEGHSLRLSPTDQTKVANWATLKVMVAEYDVNSHVITHHMQRKYLMNHHQPPKEGWAVWIGHHVRTPKGKFHWGSFPALIVPNGIVAKRKSKKATYYNSGATSQLIGQLFIQVMRSPHRKLISRWRFATPDGGALFRIWPPSDISIVWPGRSLTARDVDYAVGALKEWLESVSNVSVS